MDASRIYASFHPNFWVGRPRTAQFIPPNVAILPIGFQEASTTPDVRPRGKVRIHNAAFYNAAATNEVGFAALLPDNVWAAGQWTDSAAGNDFADDTTDAQDAGADDFGLFTTTNNDGFVIHSSMPFNVIGIDQSTASNGTSPVLEFAFWGDPVTGLSGADAWQTITPVIVPAAWGAGEKLIVLPIPIAFSGSQPVMQLSTTTGPGEGIPANRYVVRVRATTAPVTTGGSAARLYIGRSYMCQMNVPVDTMITLNQGSIGGIIEDAIGFGAFCGTTAANSAVYIEYS